MGVSGSVFSSCVGCQAKYPEEVVFILMPNNIDLWLVQGKIRNVLGHLIGEGRYQVLGQPASGLHGELLLVLVQSSAFDRHSSPNPSGRALDAYLAWGEPPWWLLPCLPWYGHKHRRSGDAQYGYHSKVLYSFEQIRKLYQPHLFPEAQVLPVFDKFFGPPSERFAGNFYFFSLQFSWIRKTVCAVGWEPNWEHTGTLDRLQKNFNACGWRVGLAFLTFLSEHLTLCVCSSPQVKIFTETGVGKVNENSR